MQKSERVALKAVGKSWIQRGAQAASSAAKPPSDARARLTPPSTKQS